MQLRRVHCIGDGCGGGVMHCMRAARLERLAAADDDRRNNLLMLLLGCGPP